MSLIDLVPIYLADRRSMLDDLAARIERAFGVAVRVQSPGFDPELCFDSSRGQYHSTLLLEHLLRGLDRRVDRVIGVTGVDLFIPVLTYVFGEAQVDGRVAVVSLHRLRPEAYGLPANARLLAERLEKEALHELGHTYGLLHCSEIGCVMRSSTYAEEIDLKPAGFCAECAARVRSAGGRPRSGQRAAPA